LIKGEILPHYERCETSRNSIFACVQFCECHIWYNRPKRKMFCKSNNWTRYSHRNPIEDNRTLSHLLFWKDKGNHCRIGGFICDKKSCSCIYMNFIFDFLGLDNVHFWNYVANELIRWVFFKPFKTLIRWVVF
jgi:hypothetical protein